MSKVDGGGGPIDPPSRLRVTIFSRRLLGLNYIIFLPHENLLHAFSFIRTIL